MKLINKRKVLFLFALVVFSFLLPRYISKYYLYVVTSITIWIIFALGFDILFGYVGLTSFGHGMFFGGGAYTAAILLSKFSISSFWFLLFSSLGVATLLGLVAISLASRVRGVFFALVTWIIMMVLYYVIYSNPLGLTGGEEGVLVSKVPAINFGLFSISVANSVNFFYLTMAFAIITFFVLEYVKNSPFGKIMVGMREKEKRLTFLGYNTNYYLYVAFLISSCTAGLAGFLYVFQIGIAAPSIAGQSISFSVLIMTLLGGRGTLIGPIIGAVLIEGLRTYLSNFIELYLIILGLLYIGTITSMPEGIFPLLRRKVREY